MKEDHGEDHGKDHGKDQAPRTRLRVLLAVLGLCLLAVVAHYGRAWFYERQLVEIAHGIIDEINREDPLPVPEQGPEADVEIRASCTFDYVVVGQMKGTIQLITKPRADAPENDLVGIEYIYVRENGEWKQTDSYHM